MLRQYQMKLGGEVDGDGPFLELARKEVAAGLSVRGDKMKVIPRDIYPSLYGIRASEPNDGAFDIMEFKDGLILYSLDKGRIGLLLSGDAAGLDIWKRAFYFNCVKDAFIRDQLIQIAC